LHSRDVRDENLEGNVMKKNINQGREEGRKVEGGTEMNRQEGID